MDEKPSCRRFQISRRPILQSFTAVGGISILGTCGAQAQESDPIKVEDWHDLDAVRDSLSDDYILTTELDSETAGYAEHVRDKDGGWEPIGGRNRFSGTFDGNGNQIANLRIDRPSEEGIGLFNYVSGVIKNLSVVDANIRGDAFTGGVVSSNYDGGSRSSKLTNIEFTGNVTGSTAVGGIISRNYGTVEDSSVSATVTGIASVGGVVGLHEDGEILNTNSEGTVQPGEDSTAGSMGGIVGDNAATIENSTTSTDVSIDSSVCGGLAGRNDGTILDSDANGRVNGGSRVGGFVGVDYDGNIKNSSATGDVSGETSVGGFVGYRSDGFDDQGNNFSGELTDAEAQGTVEGNETVGGFVGRNHFEIGNASAMGDVEGGDDQTGGFVGKNQGTISDSDAQGTIKGDRRVGGFAGNNFGDGTIVAGEADGDVQAEYLVGGFAGSNSGEIENSSTTGEVNAGNATGGFVGSNYAGEIENHAQYDTLSGVIKQSETAGSVNGADRVGGFAGKNSGTIEDSSAEDDVEGEGQIGGFVGNNFTLFSISRNINVASG